eukprot:scaffold146_cov265-Pinguiococcus_pyrenoidosus.AAC.24
MWRTCRRAEGTWSLWSREVEDAAYSASCPFASRYKIVRGGAIVQLHPDSVFANFGSPPEVVTYAEVEMRCAFP